MSKNIETFKHISAKEFAELDYSNVTLVDLREPDEVLVSGIVGAINLPFSKGFGKYDAIPKDKPVVVFCRVGDWSQQVADILADRGYDVATLDGGYNAYRALTTEQNADDKNGSSGQVSHSESSNNNSPQNKEPVYIDAKNLKCPGPIVKVADYLRDKPVGTKIIAEATEDAFASDIKVWCERTGNTLDQLIIKDGIITAYITRNKSKQETTAAVYNDKTFVVFSGDLDKTIAAFIIANGAAALG